MLCFVLHAGHLAPSTQMAMTRSLLNDLATKKSIQCLNTVEGCYLATTICGYMNSCSGQGTCDAVLTGRCTCNAGYFGADCSIQLTDFATLQTGGASIPPQSWGFYSYNSATAQTIQINGDNLEIYITQDATTIPSFSYYD